MSGLIWSGIGKGIADAGSAVGGMMFKSIDADLSEQRDLRKVAAIEKLKEQMAEDRAMRDADIYTKAQAKAQEIGTARQAKTMESDSASLAANAQTIAGDSPAMSQDELKKHLASLSPAERKAIEGTGLISKAMSPMRQELQGYDDTTNAARELGGSSTLIKSLQDAKKARLDEIKAEYKDEGDREERKLNRDREDRRDREGRERADYQDRMAGAAERRAGAAETAANRPRAGGTDPNKPATTADLQRQITAAQNSLAQELGVPKNDVNAEIASLKKKAANGNAKAQATLDSIDPYLGELQDANRRMLEFKRARPGPSENSGDNQPSRPPLSSFRR